MYIRTKFFLLITFLVLISSSASAQIKVACVGNSITENWALAPEDKYPAILQSLLGNDYEVRNYGLGGRTLLKKGDRPYWNEEKYKEVLNWNPDIVIIKLGTNDGKPQNWKFKADFESNYLEFVNSFKSLQSKPEIFVCYPIVTFPDNSLPVPDSLITQQMIPIINAVAKKTKSAIIDLHTPFEGREDLVYDKIHPNVKGTTIMARIIAKRICPKKNFPKPAIGKKVDIVFIGNSITEGTYLKYPPPTLTAMYLDSLGYQVRYSNCGISGFTSVDFLPTGKPFAKAIAAADTLYKGSEKLIFSIKLGTNDSACKGPTGAPVSAETYKQNIQTIIDSLHAHFPKAEIILHHPLWYSPNTHNSAIYLKEGLDRLQTYSPEIKKLAKENKGFVIEGDKKGFDIFRKNYIKLHTPQEGNSGTFYLHPNAEGAKILAELWAESIDKYLQSKKE